MGMQGSVPQFLLDANVAGGLSHFVIYCHERAEGFQSSSVEFRVRSPSQTLWLGQFFPLLTAGSCWDRGFASPLNFIPINFCSHEKNPHSRRTFCSASISSRNTNSDYTPSTSIREEIEGKMMIRENIQLQ
jgi:hypothetical protein